MTFIDRNGLSLLGVSVALTTLALTLAAVPARAADCQSGSLCTYQSGSGGSEGKCGVSTDGNGTSFCACTSGSNSQAQEACSN